MAAPLVAIRLACEAAMATLDLIESGLMENASKMGSLLIEKLKRLKRKYALIGDVRGKGLMIGVELVRNRKTREPAIGEAHEIAEKAFKKGLLLLPCGENVIRFSPPLIVSTDEIAVAVHIFSEILANY